MDCLPIIDDMPGPVFLLFYGCVIWATLAMCRYWVRRQDATRDLPTPAVPNDLDPAEVAYLRGGENAVTRLTVFGLLQRGYLEMIETRTWLFTRQQIQQSADHPDLNQLTRMEREVFDHFRLPLSPAKIFRSLPGIVAEHCREYQQRSEENHLLTTQETRRAAQTSGLIAAFIIVDLGGLKLLDALQEGRTNVGFLILMGIGSLMILAVICTTNRLTNFGWRYLNELQDAFRSSRDQAGMVDRVTGRAFHPDHRLAPDIFVMAAVLGTSALEGTAYAYLRDIFATPVGVCGGMPPPCGGGGVGIGGCGGG